MEEKIKNISKRVKFSDLTPEEEKGIVHKGTEKPFFEKYNKYDKVGIYACKRCGIELYMSEDKFDAGCGWPSFDDEISGAVRRVYAPDGERIEIVCANCNARLGHVFEGERMNA